MSEQPEPDQIQVFALDRAEGMSPLEGIEMRAVFGAGASLNLITLEAGAEIPPHTHPHEQIGIVVEGVEILLVEGREYHLGPMQAYVVPSEVEHGAFGGPEGCAVLDVFVPTREEYRGAATAVRDPAEYQRD